MNPLSFRKRSPLPEHIVAHLRRLQRSLQHDEPLRPKLFTISTPVPDMLDWDMMLGEALKAVDIFEKYPDFYQTLLTHAELRKNFSADLQMLIQLDQEPLFQLPADQAPPDLGFLDGLQRFRWKVVPPAGKTSIVSPSTYLNQAIFKPETLAEKLYRSGGPIEGALPLVDGYCTLNERQLKLSLLGFLDEEGYTITPDLWISTQGAHTEGAYMVHLSWDGYDDIQTVELEIAKQFVPIEIDAIMDADAETVLADLQLSILSLDE